MAGFRAALGDAHPSTLTSIGNLAALLYAEGKLEEALASFEEALAVQTATLGEAHPSTQNTLSNAQFVRAKLGR